eukprot:Rmarinus@m.21406
MARVLTYRRSHSRLGGTMRAIAIVGLVIRLVVAYMGPLRLSTTLLIIQRSRFVYTLLQFTCTVEVLGGTTRWLYSNTRRCTCGLALRGKWPSLTLASCVRFLSY